MREQLSTSQARRLALLKLLGPIVDFSLRHGISIQDLIEVAKVAMVTNAAKRINDFGSRATVSRLSVATGIHRRDIKRLVTQGESAEDWDKTVCGRVLGQWEQDRRFLTKSGKPAILSYDGPQSRFHRLVRSVTRNINPLTVMQELLQMGAVEKSPRGLVYIKRGGTFGNDKLAALDLTAQDIASLIRCVEENTSGLPELSNLHIRTEYDNIYGSRSAEIRRWVLDRGKEFHKAVRDFLATCDKDVTPSDSDEQAGTKVVVQAFSVIIPAPEKNS